MRVCLASILMIFLAAGGFARAEEIEGFGRTLEDAKLDARQHVLQRIQTSRAARESPFWAWQPTLADIDGLISGPGRAGPSIDVKPLGVQHRWVLQVNLPSEAQLILRDRQTSRQRLAALAVLGGILGCAGWWGISRARAW